MVVILCAGCSVEITDDVDPQDITADSNLSTDFFCKKCEDHDGWRY